MYRTRHIYFYRLTDRWTEGHADIRQSGRQQHSDIYVLNTCKWRAGLRDEYTDRRTPSHFSHPHDTGNYVHMLTRPYTYTLQMCLHVRTHPHPSLNIEVISLKIDVRNKKPEVRG